MVMFGLAGHYNHIEESNDKEKVFLVTIFFLLNSITFGKQVIDRQLPVKMGGMEEVRIKRMGGDITVADAPRGARVKTLGGNIRIGNARRFVQASTNGGYITIESVDGWVKARTYSGNITVNVTDPDEETEARDEETEARKDIELTSYQGDLRVMLPRNVSAIFEIELAYTNNSMQNYRIISDFDLSQEETKQWDYGRGTPLRYIFGSGVAGSGKRKIRLRTINGNIYLITSK
jgi:DUF4097 and DUF4098 domain-containing protein YvlB